MLTPEEVQKIAKLAALSIDESDVQNYAEKLTAILDLASQMNDVDTSNIEPMSHPMDISQRLRVDEVTESDQRDRLLKLAPRTEVGMFLVPKVIETIE